MDLNGKYEKVSDANYHHLGTGKFDLVQSIFTFDNIPGWHKRIKILKALAELLTPDGKIILLDSNPEIYKNEWASFTTKDFPENKYAKTGEIVKISMTDVEDKSPVEDIYWSEEDYLKLFELSDLLLEASYKPLGFDDEPFNWVSEKEIAPWIIFVLTKK